MTNLSLDQTAFALIDALLELLPITMYAHSVRMKNADFAHSKWMRKYAQIVEIILLARTILAFQLALLEFNKMERHVNLVHLNVKTIILVKLLTIIKFVLNVLRKCY